MKLSFPNQPNIPIHPILIGNTRSPGNGGQVAFRKGPGNPGQKFPGNGGAPLGYLPGNNGK